MVRNFGGWTLIGHRVRVLGRTSWLGNKFKATYLLPVRSGDLEAHACLRSPFSCTLPAPSHSPRTFLQYQKMPMVVKGMYSPSP